ncbi:unnamed protein product [Acanthoscelides obtectus]|uniref:Peptidoglycan-recognition protein n=1 Tax=Acanthoscelides obtectus TaxID=200917 RepID=A0A9P0MIG2_ACAOB|nr:unnamed protein product [Acanthoscelides obtectus]CAK1640878.1 Peptidoglycan-recognition protein 2 [Acanthoscelides obtectus]
MYSQAVVLFLCAFNVMSATADDTCPPIVSRKEWGAVPAKSVQPLSKNPPPYVVVHHSASQICTDEESCKRYVRSVQHFHMDIRGWEDIGYNFLIGGDGKVYEGRGWGIHGAHDKRHNSVSLGVSLIGNFQETEPLLIQLETLKNLLECGVNTNRIQKEYRMIGHRQSTPTLCPA